MGTDCVIKREHERSGLLGLFFVSQIHQLFVDPGKRFAFARQPDAANDAAVEVVIQADSDRHSKRSRLIMREQRQRTAERTLEGAHRARQSWDCISKRSCAQTKHCPGHLRLWEERTDDYIVGNNGKRPVERHPKEEADEEPAISQHAQTCKEGFKKAAAKALQRGPACTQFMKEIQRPLVAARQNI